MIFSMHCSDFLKVLPKSVFRILPSISLQHRISHIIYPLAILISNSEEVFNVFYSNSL